MCGSAYRLDSFVFQGATPQCHGDEVGGAGGESGRCP